LSNFQSHGGHVVGGGQEEDLRGPAVQERARHPRAGNAVTMDYDPWRVRIFVDSNDKVAEVKIG
jgi:hypothetical protein